VTFPCRKLTQIDSLYRFGGYRIERHRQRGSSL